jgi:hypothetical protein
MRYLILKKGGEPGEVAINVDRITHIRSASGPFTDIYFGDHRVAVQGTFAEIVSRVAASDLEPPKAPANQNWFPSR